MQFKLYLHLKLEVGSIVVQAGGGEAERPIASQDAKNWAQSIFFGHRPCTIWARGNSTVQNYPDQSAKITKIYCEDFTVKIFVLVLKSLFR